MKKFLKKLKEKGPKKRFSRYILVGSFIFFLIKGLIWLVVFFIAGFGLIKMN
tara:strand:- start:281 stop:436 length:156 start_codon:yes stop_codon:yes gene_type:complete